MADLPSFSTKEFYWLASCFCGIITCKLVYDLTGFISPFCFKGYGKLSDKEKMERNNRGFSTFHALIAAWASLYLLLFSDLFDEDSSNDLIVNRSSIISNMFLGFSIGYFLSDLAMVFWHFPALGGLEYVLHHGLSMFSISLSLMSSQGQIYILMVLFSESTTPFVNIRWYLDVAGRKSSTIYIYNGIALFFGWLADMTSTCDDFRLQGFFCSSIFLPTCLTTLMRSRRYFRWGSTACSLYLRCWG
ncbi:hypothetical protein E1A91_D08G000500v1 [Gossypium mustelinum]|uniref:TLC domain-containing protein n=2 Tax=Gossypium mustelinum TaxID=34275 RepID=A0A5D2TRP1_GOSMU|nr:hypothetical protein E1A91_D08G000500v1 [Gossypium mustelinum]TYI67195.1 hypothetical protein E1A91_D08G000500v1 [Gossypium mustelinum]TYI67196.1 hypothetical protein E1A91_D08G000500v1 [Gossypium mustelinum]